MLIIISATERRALASEQASGSMLITIEYPNHGSKSELDSRHTVSLFCLDVPPSIGRSRQAHHMSSFILHSISCM